MQELILLLIFIIISIVFLAVFVLSFSLFRERQEYKVSLLTLLIALGVVSLLCFIIYGNKVINNNINDLRQEIVAPKVKESEDK